MLYKTLIKNNVEVENIHFPTSIMVKLTNRCNLKCIFCSQGDAMNNDIDFGTVKKLLIEAKKYGVCEVIYSGGEPLLYPKFKEVISFGKNLGLHQVLVTNGTEIDKYIDDILSKIDSIGISLHGNENIHDELVSQRGAYQKVKRNIEILNHLKNITPKITINYTMSEKNIGKLNDVIKFSSEHDCQLSVARLNQIGRSVSNNNIQSIVDKFVNQLNTENSIHISNVIPICQMKTDKKYLCHSCSAGIASVCIETDGGVKICASSSQSFGSIKDQSLFEVWNNLKFRNFRSLNWLPEVCKTCRDFSRCLGGCKVEVYENPYTYSKDCLMKQAIKEFYEKCTENKLIFLFSNVRRIGDEFLLLGIPNRIVDKEGMDLIKTLIMNNQFNIEFNKMEKNRRKRALELLYGMYKDGLISFK